MKIFSRFGRVIKLQSSENDRLVSKTKIIYIFPFIFSKGLIMYKGFGNINYIKHLVQLRTFDKTKISSIGGRIRKIKIYSWNTPGQKCHYYGYNIYSYLNDSSIIENSFTRSDSVAAQIKYVFDNKGDILSINKLIKQRAIGWGIDVTFYAYNGNYTEDINYKYIFDDQDNWIERDEFVNGNFRNKLTRNIIYNKKQSLTRTIKYINLSWFLLFAPGT